MIREPKSPGKLELIAISKTHANGTVALHDLDVAFVPGITGLIGANGAGKTTLLKILATTMKPTAGRMLFEGVDVVKSPNRLRKRLGYVPQHVGVYPRLDACEFVSYLAILKGVPLHHVTARSMQALAAVGLADVAKRRLEGFSRGMLQRVAIAQALINDPDILLLDEPSAGLDPAQRHNFREVLSSLATTRTVIFSTHILSDLEGLTNSIVVMRSGKIVLRGGPAEILANVRGRVWEWRSRGMPAHVPGHVLATYREADDVRLRILAEEAPSAAAVRVEPTLEEACNVALMGSR